MSRQKRDEPQRGEKRKTLFTTGWHRDPRFRYLPLHAKELYRVLWDLARDHMREILPMRFWDTRVLADEVGSDVTEDQISAGLTLLSSNGNGSEPLIDLVKGVGIRVRGIRSVHSAIDAWRFPGDDSQGAIAANRLQTIPKAAGGDVAKASPEGAPAELAAYDLFAAHQRLCRSFSQLTAAWEAMRVDWREEMPKAHAYAVRKTAQGTPYRDYVRFLGNWMARVQDRQAKFTRLRPQRPSEISDEQAKRALAKAEEDFPA